MHGVFIPVTVKINDKLEQFYLPKQIAIDIVNSHNMSNDLKEHYIYGDIINNHCYILLGNILNDSMDNICNEFEDFSDRDRSYFCSRYRTATLQLTHDEFIKNILPECLHRVYHKHLKEYFSVNYWDEIVYEIIEGNYGQILNYKDCDIFITLCQEEVKTDTCRKFKPYIKQLYLNIRFKDSYLCYPLFPNLE